jgi:hypothetical protein
MDAVHVALAEAAAPCSMSELADRLAMRAVDVVRGLRGLVRAGRALVTDDGYVSSGSITRILTSPSGGRPSGWSSLFRAV